MSDRNVNRSLERLKEPSFFSGLVVVIVFAVTLGVWQYGGFERFELQLYDRLTVKTRRLVVEPTPVVLVPIEEVDISDPRWGGFPLRDSTCADILERIIACNPDAVGLDLYRDIPVPFDGSQREELNKVLAENERVVGIFLMGEDGVRAVPAPSVLLEYPEQIGFNDFPRDNQADQIVRRALLFMGDDTGTVTSFALQLAQMYLESKEIYLEPSEDHPSDLRLGGMRLNPLTGSEGGYVDADARGMQVLIDFRNEVKFPKVTLSELMSDTFDSTRLQGKVVVVGMWAPSIKDTLQTPLEADYPGPELQALMVDQLIRGALAPKGTQRLRSLGEGSEGILLFFACCLGVLAGFLSRSTLQAVGAAVGAGGLILFSVYLAFGAGLWIPGVMLLIGCIASNTLVVAYRSSYEKKQNNILMHIFSQHVSGKIAAQIWENRVAFLEGNFPRPQKVHATVLFCDLRGFTTISESLEPTVLIDWLNEYMEDMSRIIIANDGVIGKYIGDAIMAMFGVPVPRTSRDEISHDAIHAVKAAMEMELALEELHKKWGPRGLPCAKMRIGIYTGDMVAGSVGGRERLEYTVIGDTVNVASRLESFQRDFEHPRLGDRVARTLIGSSTRALLDDSFETIQIGDMTLKGKSESLALFLVCRDDYPSTDNRPPTTSPTDPTERES